jgi:hypothetical protein
VLSRGTRGRCVQGQDVWGHSDSAGLGQRRTGVEKKKGRPPLSEDAEAQLRLRQRLAATVANGLLVAAGVAPLAELAGELARAPADPVGVKLAGLLDVAIFPAVLDVQCVDFVSVPTRDPARSRRFYADVLGLSPSTLNPTSSRRPT